ncbi:hypothetical protein WICMUC_004112 [Wickerhamomyces mucosus]|uniref:DNA mismatch repair protein S5 domain-containing protein n=1 Tax=Wickerhamomyces mucosus TaxID=1378264 RepID=A0A9P8TB78_9ASCO|nr:hypothetical protein WICMUC_004112 [Wickerhamomyces mucosus]
MATISRIKALDPTVINRIAAGEIIIAPVNALKELLENSIDAGSTIIEILAKDGGIKLLQITDNGSGIDENDLPILCHRFTTSKLTKFEDLTSIETYGFRGEALASISHIAHLSVLTRTRKSSCGWKAIYSDGELTQQNGSNDPIPAAGKIGTTFTIEDFFYNVPSRLRALKTANDEFTKILDVIGRYAIHCNNVGFSCKKFGDSHYLLNTRPNLPIQERIRAVFGSSISNDLVQIDIENGFNDLGVKRVYGQVTSPNFNNKKPIQPVFFINNRLVSNDTLRRALLSSMNRFLPKGHKPFIYLSLSIDPRNLDVNVHPTKREVKFLNEDEIIDRICLKVIEELSKIDSSRNFSTQTLKDTDRKNLQESDSSQAYKKPKYDYNLVRVDSQQSKITSYLFKPEMDSQGMDTSKLSSTLIQAKEYTVVPKETVDHNLQSIIDLREEVKQNTSKKLTNIFTNISYIGIVDPRRRLCSVQHDVKLLLIDYGAILNELFYQIALWNFGNYGILILKAEAESSSVSIEKLLLPLYNSEFNPNQTIQDIQSTLEENSEMFEEYFSLKFENGTICQLPLLIKNYTPPLSKLSIFIYNLATKINYNDEKECLKGILKHIALLYVPLSFGASDEFQTDTLNEILENVLVPHLRKNFLAPIGLNSDIVEIANLPGLYKVFERC